MLKTLQLKCDFLSKLGSRQSLKMFLMIPWTKPVQHITLLRVACLPPRDVVVRYPEGAFVLNSYHTKCWKKYSPEKRRQWCWEEIQRCMSFTEKIVVGKFSGKVMHSGKVMPDCKWVLRKFPLKSCKFWNEMKTFP